MSVGEVEPVVANFVGRLAGADLSIEIDRATADRLRTAHRDYPVLVIPDQRLRPEQFLAVAETFGEIEIDRHLPQYQHPDDPRLIYITNLGADGKPVPQATSQGEVWHADSTFKAAPCAHTMLYARKLPSAGGGTLYADMVRAYETLPAELKSAIADRRAVHRHGAGPAEGGVVPMTERQKAEHPAVEQPMVRVHPETGQSALYVNPLHTCGVVGMGEAEGRALLERLFTHQQRDEFVYHHHWRVGEIVIWDQRRTIHRGAGDYPADETRLLWRAKMAGVGAQAIKGSEPLNRV